MMQYSTEISTEPTTFPHRGPQQPLRPVDDLLCYFREYSREKPETLALVCLAVGFVLGWKLKPW